MLRPAHFPSTFSVMSRSYCSLLLMLQEIMAGRHDMGNGSAAEVLGQAIEAAERFPNLKVSHCVI